MWKLRPVGSIAIYSFSMCIVISVSNIAWKTVSFCPNQTITSAVSFTLMIYKHYHFHSSVLFDRTCANMDVCRCAGAQEGEIHAHRNRFCLPHTVILSNVNCLCWVHKVDSGDECKIQLTLISGSIWVAVLLSYSLDGKNFIYHKTITSGWIALFKHRVNSECFTSFAANAIFEWCKSRKSFFRIQCTCFALRKKNKRRKSCAWYSRDRAKERRDFSWKTKTLTW